MSSSEFNGGPQKLYPYPGTWECDIIWEKSLSDVINLRISKWAHPGLSR